VRHKGIALLFAATAIFAVVAGCKQSAPSKDDPTSKGTILKNETDNKGAGEGTIKAPTPPPK